MKCQTTPTKKETLPNIAIQAALYAARLRRLFKEDLDIATVNICRWCDSLTRLQWLC